MTGRLLFVCSLLTLAACGRACGASEELAELAARVGREVQRDEGETEGHFHHAELGTRFRMGDGLRTGAHSSAELRLLPSGSAHVEPHSLLRFLASVPARPARHVALESGELDVLAGQIDIEIHTPRAVARLSRGGRLKLSMRDGRERFDLVVGRVTVAHAGSTVVLAPNLPLELGADAERELLGEPALEAEGKRADAGSEQADADSASSDSSLTLDHGSPAREALAPTELRGVNAPSALRLQLLESAVVHVSAVPVDVTFPAADCTQPSALSIDGQDPVRLAEGTTARLHQGSHRVLVRCADHSRRELKLVVKRDAARLELPKRAQGVRVEADGRRYTVRYQNLLPDLTIVWPGEASEGEFTLLVRSGKRELKRALSRPEHVLSGALLGEGEHTFWFRDGGGRSSKPTILRLAFDNTARSAYLSLPIEGSAVNEDAVPVEGAALVHSQVSIEGRPAKLDEQGRFRAQIALGPVRKAISVRVEHPGSGVHYYLRHVR